MTQAADILMPEDNSISKLHLELNFIDETTVEIVDTSTTGTLIKSPDDDIKYFITMQPKKPYKVFHGTQLDLSHHISIHFVINDNVQSTMGEITIKVCMIL